MWRIITVLITLLATIGCKSVNVSLPIPVRISAPVGIEESDSTFAESTFVPSQLLSDEISEQVAEGEDVTVDLESVVLIVRQNASPANTVVNDAGVEVALGVGSPLERLASVDSLDLERVIDQAVRPRLYEEGVNVLNTFVSNTLAGADDVLVVAVDGSASKDSLDFVIDVVFTFTLVVVEEMTSIGP